MDAGSAVMTDPSDATSFGTSCGGGDTCELAERSEGRRRADLNPAVAVPGPVETGLKSRAWTRASIRSPGSASRSPPASSPALTRMVRSVVATTVVSTPPAGAPGIDVSSTAALYSTGLRRPHECRHGRHAAADVPPPTEDESAHRPPCAWGKAAARLACVPPPTACERRHVFGGVLPRSMRQPHGAIGSRHNASSAWAIARGSSGGTSTPAWPSRSMNRMSPVGVETTGSPAESASMIDTGWLSMTDAFTNTSASAYSAGMCSGSIRPTKRKVLPANMLESHAKYHSWLQPPASVRSLQYVALNKRLEHDVDVSTEISPKETRPEGRQPDSRPDSRPRSG